MNPIYRTAVLLHSSISPRLVALLHYESTLIRRHLLATSWRRCLHAIHDPENKGEQQGGVNFDTLGTWNNRLDLDINVEESIRKGKPIPKITHSKVGDSSLEGRRNGNEDRYVVKRLDVHDSDLLLCGVFDGHGGSLAAEYACCNMEKRILYWWRRGLKDLQAVLRKSFTELNNEFARHVTLNHIEDGFQTGTTATVCLLRNGHELILGHTGDSRALLCRQGVPKRLTVCHVPENPVELERVSKCGAQVTTSSVGVQLINGRLAMTRSIGDLELKAYGVVAEPQTWSMEIKHGQDSFLALTTDGINFVMNDDEICDTINRCQTPQEAAGFLTDQALQYGSDDNATAVIIPFGAWGKYRSANTNLQSYGYIRWTSRG